MGSITEPERRAKVTLALASLAVLAVSLDTTALFVAFPDLIESFPDVSRSGLSWVLNGYTIVVASLLVTAGRLADRTGRRRTFLLGSVVFTVGSLLCAVAPTVPFLLAARAVQGAGAALLVPASLALVLRAFPAERLPVAIAVWGAAGAVAAALGPTLGAALVELSGWRLVFLINLPVGVATVLLGRRHVEESKDLGDARVPGITGVVLLAAVGGLLSLGVVQGEGWGWSDARTIGALVAGVAALVALVVHQGRSTKPVVDLRLFEVPSFRWANLATLTYSIGFSAMFFGSILFLTQVWGWSVLAAGFGIAPGPLLVAALAPRFGKLAARVGQRPVLVAGGLVYALGGLFRIAFLGAEHDYVTDYLPSMVLTGIGVACCLPQLSSTATRALPPGRFAVGSGINQAVRQLGMTFGVAATVALLGVPAGLDDALRRFDRVWALIAVGGLATAALSAPLRTRPAAAQAPAAAPAVAPAA